MKLKQALTNIAPLLGNLIGGPLGGTAGQAVSKILLGKSNASERELEKALNNISAEHTSKLKELDARYQTQLLSLQLDEKRLSVQDRDSARQRALACQDKVPAILAILMTLGFFATLGCDDVCAATRKCPRGDGCDVRLTRHRLDNVHRLLFWGILSPTQKW